MTNKPYPHCHKLGSALHFHKPMEKFIDNAVYVLTKDFYLNKTKLFGKEIKIESHNAYSYDHIFKLDEPNLSDDQKKMRTKIAPQIKKLINLVDKNECCDNILTWTQVDSKSHNKKLYILCREVRLMVILIINKNFYHLRTAYFVDNDKMLGKYIQLYTRYSGLKK